MGATNWHSGDSLHLSPMFVFNSWTWCHSVMQVASVVGFVLASKVSFGLSCFLLSRSCNTSELQFDLEIVEKEPLSLGAPGYSFIFIIFYQLFIFLKEICILYTSWQKKQAIRHCIRWSMVTSICNNRNITTCMSLAYAENWNQMIL